MINYLEKLCLTDGISGDELAVAETIKSFLPDNCSIIVDPLNNLIVSKKGKKKSSKKIMLTAHMDEVGFIVTSIQNDGSILFSEVGGVVPNVVIGSRVLIGNTLGVVGYKPIHLQDVEEKNKIVKHEELFVDIGAKNKEEAIKSVAVGMSISFVSDFVKFGDNKVKCKAIDDRFGCSLLLKLLNEYDDYDLTCAFLVQEEVGLIGAKTAAFTVSPDYAIVLDATTAGDLPGIDDEKKVCSLGGGVVVPFKDSRTIYDKDLFDLAFNLAEKNNIKIQTKTMIAGANDSFAICSSNGGIKTVSLNIPCRYIHSPSCVASIFDIEQAYKLATVLVDYISSLEGS